MKRALLCGIVFTATILSGCGDSGTTVTATVTQTVTTDSGATTEDSTTTTDSTAGETTTRTATTTTKSVVRSKRTAGRQPKDSIKCADSGGDLGLATDEGGSCAAGKEWRESFKLRGRDWKKYELSESATADPNPPISEWRITGGDRGVFTCDWADYATDLVKCTDEQGSKYYLYHWLRSVIS